MEQKIKDSPLSKFFSLVIALENFFLCVMMVGMVCVILIQILGRVLSNPFPWTEEMSRYMFLWMMFVALAAGFNKAESSRVTILLQYCPKWIKKFSEILYVGIVIAFFLFMIVWGMEVVKQQLMFNEMGTALLIPMWVIGICQPVSGVLGILGVVNSLLFHKDKIEVRDKESEKLKLIGGEEE